MNNWYVITGAPSSGKTKLINDLALRGYTVSPEVPRQVIDQALAAGISVAELRRDELEFQRTVLGLRLGLEKYLATMIQPNRLLFCDRGLGDCAAYFEFAGGKDHPDLLPVRTAHYRKVFLLDPLDYRTDYARTESAEDVVVIDKLLEQAYTRLGSQVVRVPVLARPQRAQFVLDML